MSESLGDAASHFTTEAGGVPAHPGRYVNIDELTATEFLPGLGFRPVLGHNAMVNFVNFAPGAEAPRHVHEEEQIVIVLEGELTFDVDGGNRVDLRVEISLYAQRFSARHAALPRLLAAIAPSARPASEPASTSPCQSARS